MERLWFLLTHKFKLVKINGWWRVEIKERGKWFVIADKRFLSKTNATNYVKEIKQRGFV